jgi:hypothetical protein
VPNLWHLGVHVQTPSVCTLNWWRGACKASRPFAHRAPLLRWAAGSMRLSYAALPCSLALFPSISCIQCTECMRHPLPSSLLELVGSPAAAIICTHLPRIARLIAVISLQRRQRPCAASYAARPLPCHAPPPPPQHTHTHFDGTLPKPHSKFLGLFALRSSPSVRLFAVVPTTPVQRCPPRGFDAHCHQQSIPHKPDHTKNLPSPASGLLAKPGDARWCPAAP